MAEVTKTVRDTVIDMVMKGADVNMIVEETGLARGTVYGILREEGLGMAAKRSLEQEVKMEGLVEAYQTRPQDSVLKIITEFGVTYTMLYNELAKRGIPTREFNANVEGAGGMASGRQARLEQAVKLYLEGVPNWRIVQETGIQTPTLYSVIHKLGLPLRRGGAVMPQEEILKHLDRFRNMEVKDAPQTD